MQASPVWVSPKAKTLVSDNGVCARTEAKKIKERMQTTSPRRKLKIRDKHLNSLTPRTIEPSGHTEGGKVIYFSIATLLGMTIVNALHSDITPAAMLHHSLWVDFNHKDNRYLLQNGRLQGFSLWRSSVQLPPPWNDTERWPNLHWLDWTLFRSWCIQNVRVS